MNFAAAHSPHLANMWFIVEYKETFNSVVYPPAGSGTARRGLRFHDKPPVSPPAAASAFLEKR